MISFEDALHLVLQHQKDFGTEQVDLLTSIGRILAQEVVADRDFPPYHRVMMDGIAISSSAYEQGIRTFEIEGIQAAGSPQQTLKNTSNCIEVMTGAVLPANTDAIVPYEQCSISQGVSTVNVEQITPMQSVHLQGADSKKGEVLIAKHEKVTAAMVGIMASVGLSTVEVLRRPTVTICSTGDELVEVSEQPKAHQVRKSNVYMLASALSLESIHADTIHLRDDPEEMTATITDLIKSNDVILFSGAVSKGKFDYLPSVLEKIGMEQVFHTIAQRPGKPFLFGRFSSTLIFGFPGNPVSTFVCYHQFFKRWLHASLHYQPQPHLAQLATNFDFKPALAYHLLVSLSNGNGTIIASPITGSGSGDLVTLTKAEGLITLPAERDHFNEGEVFDLNVVL